MSSIENKRIAQNSAFLYFRLLFLMGISLFTVRITLNALGDIDYGIYNVVASVVTSLGFITGILTSATQRFFAYHLGRNDFESYNQTYSLLIIVFILIGLIVLIISECIGNYVIDNWLVIPYDRISAAKWVYQTSIVTFILNLLAIPFMSSIVANERMKAFAYISIIDGVFKLLMIYLLLLFPIDRLIFYGVIMMVESFMIIVLYYLYCHKYIPYCRFKFVWDKNIFREISAYTGWNMVGSISGILAIQGQNILLNLFCGPIINTAKGIADRVGMTVNSFSTNLYMAVSPQIVKSYASGNLERMHHLALASSRISFLLLLVLSYPLIISMQFILRIWLGAQNVTPDMVHFSQLALVQCVFISLEQPITQMIRATGNLKNYQIRVGIWTLMFLPIAYLVLWLGAPPTSTMVVLILINIFVQIVRMRVARDQVNLKFYNYLHQVIIPIISTSSLCVLLYIGILQFPSCESFLQHLGVFVLSFFCGILIIWCAGLKKSDKTYLLEIIKQTVTKHKYSFKNNR